MDVGNTQYVKFLYFHFVKNIARQILRNRCKEGDSNS